MKEIAEFLQFEMKMGESSSQIAAFFIFIIGYLALFAACYLGWRLFQKINRSVFEKLIEKHGRSMKLEFLERVFSLLITITFVVIPFNLGQIRQSIFGSAAVLTAIVGFAAQDIIKDILSGLQISIYKPFDIGDRIELPDGSAGIVENITMRHVVLRRIDTLRVVIPNSQMNGYSVLNYSYADTPRSMVLTFPVGYRSDIQKTKAIIEGVVKDSPLTIPGKQLPDGSMDYAKAYFIDLTDSALVMSITVYYDQKEATEKVKDAINTGVFEALGKNGIEIPYSYTNVVMK